MYHVEGLQIYAYSVLNLGFPMWVLLCYLYMVLVLEGIQFVVVGLEVVHFCLVYFYKWDIKDMKKGTILHWFMLSAVLGYAKIN